MKFFKNNCPNNLKIVNMKTKMMISALFVFAIILLPQISKAQSVINYEVVSDGLSGKKLIKDLEKNGIHLTDYVLPVLNYYEFSYDSSFTFELAIIRGSIIPLDSNELSLSWKAMEKVKKFGKEKGYTAPPIEVAYLLRKKISNEEMKQMGFSTLIIMNEPMKNPTNNSFLFAMDNKSNFFYCLCFINAHFSKIDDVGFVFLDPKKTYSNFYSK